MNVVVKAGGPSPMEDVPVLLLPHDSSHTAAPVPEPSAGQPWAAAWIREIKLKS